jgi:hypothetical protein
MKRHQLRDCISNTSQPLINICSDGYDYFVQVYHHDEMSLLRDNQGKREIFKNLGDAEAMLRGLGIHHAVLSHAMPHDETASRGSMTMSNQETRMPLWF